MCQALPGRRCAGHARDQAQQSLADYIRAFPGSTTPVNVLDAAAAVLEVAGLSRGDLATSAGAPASSTPLAVPPPRARPNLYSFGPVRDGRGTVQMTERSWNVPDPASDDVEVDGQMFHRRRSGLYPDWPDGIRIEANRPLTNAEVEHMADLVAYAQRTELRSTEPMTGPFRDGPNSFVLYQDATKTSSDDSGAAYERFEDRLPELVRDGTPVRKTDRTGPKGTRAVEGLGDGITFSIWYDDMAE